MNLWKLRISFFIVIACVGFSACSTQPFQGKIDAGKREKYLAQGIDARILATGRPPQLGLALAGGGTKAGDFSIGVLQGLTEAGVMAQVDAVSTVSGGGYAALWYFSRLLNPEENPEILHESTKPRISSGVPNGVFRDCIPLGYVKSYLDTKNPVHDQVRHASGSVETPSGPCPSPYTNYEPDEHSVFGKDEVRHQNHLRGYQDIFAWDWIGPFRYTQTSLDQSAAIGDYAGLAFATIGSTALNLVPNLVFDWEIPVSISRRRYEAGIVRAFGATPFNCAKAPSRCKGAETSRPAGAEDWVRNSLTFDLLKREYERGTIPLWIINATAGENRDLIHFGAGSGQKPFQFSSFEFSPYGSGSGLFHYSERLLGDLFPWEAVTSSAAFLDAQQKVMVPKINPVLKFFTLDWGRTIRNPNIDGLTYWLHHIVPFPFYLWHGRAGEEANDYVNIRLSDGGQSEDLGAYALIQRKLPDIIISDHSFDRGGRMEDVCRLRSGLMKEHGDDIALYVFFPGLQDLDTVCNQDSELGYDVFDWSHPILLGCVTSDPGDKECKATAAANKVHFQRVYLVKPSLPSSRSHHQLGKTLFELNTVLCKDENECKSEKHNRNSGREKGRRAPTGVPSCIALPAGELYPYMRKTAGEILQNWQYEDFVSCELVSFLIRNASNLDEGVDERDGCPYFPQNETVNITANSSPFLFGAYRELGRYYARQLGWFFGLNQGGQPISQLSREDRYRKAVEAQINDQLSPKPINKNGGKAGPVGRCLK